MPLRQGIAHMPPERCLGPRDLLDEALVGGGDCLPEVKARKIRAPASLPGSNRSHPPRLRRAHDGHG
jgi:hypothetical protein